MVIYFLILLLKTLFHSKMCYYKVVGTQYLKFKFQIREVTMYLIFLFIRKWWEFFLNYFWHSMLSIGTIIIHNSQFLYNHQNMEHKFHNWHLANKIVILMFVDKIVILMLVTIKFHWFPTICYNETLWYDIGWIKKKLFW